MSRFSRPPKVYQRTRRSSLHAVLIVAGFLALGLFLNEKYVTRHTVPQAVAAPSDDEIYTGSILFTPPEGGTTCRQLLFDNRTGGFNDNGNVDCELAAYQGTAKTNHWPSVRLRAISRAFH